MNDAWTEEEILKHIEETYGVELEWKGEGWKVIPRISWPSGYGYSYRRARSLSSARLSWYLSGDNIGYDDRHIHTKGTLAVDKLTKEKIGQKLDKYCNKAQEIARYNRSIKENRANGLKQAQEALNIFTIVNGLPNLEAKEAGNHGVQFNAYLHSDRVFDFMLTDTGGIGSVRFAERLDFPRVRDIMVEEVRRAADKRKRWGQPI